MKIAVASEGKFVTGHFGHCTNFMIYEAQNRKILREESIPNPGHKPGFLPNFLADRGVNVIISGGMGGGAVDIFNERNVESSSAPRAIRGALPRNTCGASSGAPAPFAMSTSTPTSAADKAPPVPKTAQ
jgi:predicted Fe-Mo cluster-binding NifX family protein